jgi:hypothetical protein
MRFHVAAFMLVFAGLVWMYFQWRQIWLPGQEQLDWLIRLLPSKWWLSAPIQASVLAVMYSLLLARILEWLFPVSDEKEVG